jgi:hypothetical protein
MRVKFDIRPPKNVRPIDAEGKNMCVKSEILCVKDALQRVLGNPANQAKLLVCGDSQSRGRCILIELNFKLNGPCNDQNSPCRMPFRAFQYRSTGSTTIGLPWSHSWPRVCFVTVNKANASLAAAVVDLVSKTLHASLTSSSHSLQAP